MNTETNQSIMDKNNGLVTLELLDRSVDLAEKGVELGLFDNVVEGLVAIGLSVQSGGDEAGYNSIIDLAMSGVEYEDCQDCNDCDCEVVGECEFSEDIEDCQDSSELNDEIDGWTLSNLLSFMDPEYELGTVRSIYNRLAERNLLKTHFFGENNHFIAPRISKYIVRIATNGTIYWKVDFINFLKKEFEKDID